MFGHGSGVNIIIMSNDEKETAFQLGGLKTAVEQQGRAIQVLFEKIDSITESFSNIRISIQSVVDIGNMVHRQGEELRTLLAMRSELTILTTNQLLLENKQKELLTNHEKLEDSIAEDRKKLTRIGIKVGFIFGGLAYLGTLVFPLIPDLIRFLAHL